MKTSNQGLVELVGHEGVCLSKYKDSVGVWTIGIGATKTEIPDIANWPLDKKISMQDAFTLLSKSIVKYEEAINNAIKLPIRQYQFDALVSWCYNVGTGYARPVYDRKGNKTRDEATVIKLINKGIVGQSLADALMMFRKPPEILLRRSKEAKLISTGKYSNNGKALLFPVSSRGYPIYSKGTNINVWEFLSVSSEIGPETEKVPKDIEREIEVRPSIWEVIKNKLLGEHK